ncbi:MULTISPECIES: DUF805 domain-containing protein [Sphingobium]|jgi:uncharacterized membrane protein YhaH (DUF805 family)|uniref:DUF805 domain-containing protein n=2 Tax=Sphingobium fuliginis (strain ATCC 27551) TaxID=336203 RepID=A0A292Z9T2_SPHSA|nr:MULTISPECIES: DUF805 domain-containing protein [Sphingobium]OAP31203.1 hypothetical protein A8O16_14175 [Sphingobium sp. 20006FA]AJR22903.1 membrane protein [Sphingobium sp. YBL2]KXU31276.1 hypothetical protein AXW74_13040 [Sphingobium sp. AM]KYC31321.1 hypothetical protein A0J57_16270 [Sphingobium sp. 22B]MCB4862429.1 DUF805 domain-containing protein [Sphingobium sp. PNB]
MEWMLLPLRRYAKFSGRARPREYWMFVLFLLLCYIGVAMVEGILGLSTTDHWFQRGPWWAGAGYSTRGGPLTGLFTLAMIIPHIAVSVRRLHDTDRSGWWLLIVFFPIIGSIVLLIFFIMSGTRGPNRFGPDPVEVGEPELR